MISTETTIEIPAYVKDNSEAVTDYAFMRHRAPDKGVRNVWRRDEAIRMAPRFDYTWYTWRDVNPDGQRCRFDMLVGAGGVVVGLLHTVYFTRVPCTTHDTRYAHHYASITDQDGVTTIASPVCNDCLSHLRRSAADSGMTLNLSECLHVGQH